MLVVRKVFDAYDRGVGERISPHHVGTHRPSCFWDVTLLYALLIHFIQTRNCCVGTAMRFIGLHVSDKEINLTL